MFIFILFFFIFFIYISIIPFTFKLLPRLHTTICWEYYSKLPLTFCPSFICFVIFINIFFYLMVQFCIETSYIYSLGFYYYFFFLFFIIVIIFLYFFSLLLDQIMKFQENLYNTREFFKLNKLTFVWSIFIPIWLFHWEFIIFYFFCIYFLTIYIYFILQMGFFDFWITYLPFNSSIFI